MSNLSEEKPHEEPEKVAKKPVEKMGKQKHGEEHGISSMVYKIMVQNCMMKKTRTKSLLREIGLLKSPRIWMESKSTC